MLMAGGSHHPSISILGATAGSTTTTTAGGAADGSTSIATRAGMERSRPLRCPRCDSSNTKFCYYNNYSLSQPRHFCKACKRYWTRGGTLRNVPVGGGCRKNKRTKKHISSSSTSPSTTTTSSSANPAPMPPLSSYHTKPTPIATAAATSSSSGLGPLFYGRASDVSQLAFPNPCVPYDLQSLGLFPSNADPEYFLPGRKTDLAEHGILQQTAPPPSTTPSLSSLLHDSSFFGFTSTSFASLRVPSLKPQQQPRISQNPNVSQYTTLLSHVTGENLALLNNVKVEGDRGGSTSGGTNEYTFNWQIPSCESAMQETAAAEASPYWNAAAAASFSGGTLL